MKVLAVLANDKKKSLNRTIFERVIQHCREQTWDVDHLDLYEHAHEIPFYVQPKAEASITGKTLQDSPFFQQHQERIMQAHMLIIVAPIYWYSVPGILKSWLDLITNFAWKYRGKRYAEPKHTIKKVLVVTTMSMPWFYKVCILRNAIKRHIREIFRFIGVPECDVYEITSVYKQKPQDIEQHMTNIIKRVV